jgi:hypothetical protein
MSEATITITLDKDVAEKYNAAPATSMHTIKHGIMDRAAERSHPYGAAISGNGSLPRAAAPLA